MSIEIKGLVKIYNQQRAVDNISFIAKNGEVLGFLGPNGAGKSTTMKIITGFLTPNAGSVEVDGYSVLTQSMEVKRRIGYLPENNPLYEDMYVKEYLGFVGSIYKIKGELLNKRIAEMIETTGLVKEQKKKAGQLSKGYKQRLGLAAALIHNPSVLILDEPTSGLDPNQVVEIRNLIKQLGKEKTVIFSTHIMQEVEHICDRVVIINSGKIVADNQLENITVTPSDKYVISIESASPMSKEILLSISSVIQLSEFTETKATIESWTDIRPELFKVFTSQNWSLLEMKLVQKTLENTFRELTRK
ncbi:MAG: gliding motility-associated ABC transporter ATP-binding subunit GldA [Bacteroidota bacterium]|nr:gliding motility-associated ABC transporter ATP-binding subunit GldA [Bacteroidota bacterium]